MTAKSTRASTETVLRLGGPQAAFARGGNRLVFVHPRHPDRCVKVQRPDRSPRLKRAARHFPRNLRPLRHFDDNWQERRVYRRLQRHLDPRYLQLVARLYGPVDTDLGPGLCSELIRDDDGAISRTLKQYLWLLGETPALRQVLADFRQHWQRLGIASRALLLHNLVVQCRQGIPQRIVVIDGLGWPQGLFLAWWYKPLARHRAGRRLRHLDRAIHDLLDKREQDLPYGEHGWLTEEQRGSR